MICCGSKRSWPQLRSKCSCQEKSKEREIDIENFKNTGIPTTGATSRTRVRRSRVVVLLTMLITNVCMCICLRYTL